jgi:hypothetical protein
MAGKVNVLTFVMQVYMYEYYAYVDSNFLV